MTVPDWTTPQYHPYRGELPCPRCQGSRLAVQHQGYEGGRRTWMHSEPRSQKREALEVGIFLALLFLGLFAATWLPVVPQ